MYNVFSVDICFHEYEADYIIIGAESKEDLKNHWNEICKENGLKFKKSEIKEIFKDEEYWSRVEKIDHLFTDTPYVRLTSFGYIE